MKVVLTNVGASIISIDVPDRTGAISNVVLGLPKPESYLANPAYLGAVIGRFGNRIANGRFSIDGREFELECNNFPGGIPCHLHGGIDGFDKRIWDLVPDEVANALTFGLMSPDGDQGYPGELTVRVRYVLEDSRLSVAYWAHSDLDTLVNLTQHSYFNLSGQANSTILDHVLQLHASRFTPISAGLVPTGEIAPVLGTPFDFLTPHKIGARIASTNQQLEFGQGYDHNWVLEPGDGVHLAAQVWEAESGRTLKVFTDQPGIQFYSGNFLAAPAVDQLATFGARTGFCLETQHFPDSPNHANFPSTVLRSGEVYSTTTDFEFGIT